MITSLALLCGALTMLPAFIVWPVVFFVLLVVGHVLGNRLGTTLRADADHDLFVEQQLRLDASPPRTPARPRDLRPSRWHESAPLSRWYFLSAGAWAVAGAIAGSIVTSQSLGPQETLPQSIFLALTCGFLGGFFGFLLSVMVSTLVGGLLEAQREGAPDRKQH
ncbi:MAG TPA: hypothetical protein VFE24_14765 [Pirellulales bacterium]|nr:hypothetical protein [Pirellulales bacterium]